MLLVLTVQEQINKKPQQPKKNQHTPPLKKKKKKQQELKCIYQWRETGNNISQTAEDGNPILKKNSGARSTSH